MSTKALAKRIKLARQEMGITQADLAYRMGISAQLVSAFESGRIPPAPKYLEKISQFTHQPLSFFTGEKIAEALDKVNATIAELEKVRDLLMQAHSSDKNSDSSEEEI